MIPYLIATLVSCLFAALAQRYRGQRQAGLYMLLSALPLFLLAALRVNIGTDWWFSYAPEYDALKWAAGGSDPGAVGLLSSVENAQIHYKNAFHAPWLFRQAELLLIALGADVQWLFVLCSAVITGLVFTAIYRQSEHPALAVFLFVFSSNYFLGFNIMRQYMAVALCLVAFEPAQKRRLPLFLLLVALAAALHTSALVFLPVYWLYGLRIKPRAGVLLVVAALVLSPLVRWALETLVPVLLPKYAWYFGSRFDSGSFEGMFFAIGLAVFALASYYYRVGEEKPYFRLWYAANLLGLLCLSFSAVVPLMKRLNYYYAACHFLFIPLLISLEGNAKRRRLLLAAVIVLFLAETAVAVVLMNKNGVYPYQSILQQTPAAYKLWATP